MKVLHLVFESDTYPSLQFSLAPKLSHISDFADITSISNNKVNVFE